MLKRLLSGGNSPLSPEPLDDFHDLLLGKSLVENDK
jgi:hypothetical protein